MTPPPPDTANTVQQVIKSDPMPSPGMNGGPVTKFFLPPSASLSSVSSRRASFRSSTLTLFPERCFCYYCPCRAGLSQRKAQQNVTVFYGQQWRPVALCAIHFVMTPRKITFFVFLSHHAASMSRIQEICRVPCCASLYCIGTGTLLNAWVLILLYCETVLIYYSVLTLNSNRSITAY